MRRPRDVLPVDLPARNAPAVGFPQPPVATPGESASPPEVTGVEKLGRTVEHHGTDIAGVRPSWLHSHRTSFDRHLTPTVADRGARGQRPFLSTIKGSWLSRILAILALLVALVIVVPAAQAATPAPTPPADGISFTGDPVMPARFQLRQARAAAIDAYRHAHLLAQRAGIRVHRPLMIMRTSSPPCSSFETRSGLVYRRWCRENSST